MRSTDRRADGQKDKQTDILLMANTVLYSMQRGKKRSRRRPRKTWTLPGETPSGETSNWWAWHKKTSIKVLDRQMNEKNGLYDLLFTRCTKVVTL